MLLTRTILPGSVQWTTTVRIHRATRRHWNYRDHKAIRRMTGSVSEDDPTHSGKFSMCASNPISPQYHTIVQDNC